MIRLILLAMAAWLATSSFSHARLGETLEQCTARYGKATPVTLMTNELDDLTSRRSERLYGPFKASDLTTYLFEKGGLTITICFVKDKAEYLLFRVKPKATPEGDAPEARVVDTYPSPVQMETLLAANSSGKEWKKTTTSNTTRNGEPFQNFQLEREDGAGGTTDFPGARSGLALFSPAWPALYEAMMREMKQARAQSERKYLEENRPHLGETLEVCTERYGKGTPAVVKAPEAQLKAPENFRKDYPALEAPGFTAYDFEKGRIRLCIAFIDNKAEWIRFQFLSETGMDNREWNSMEIDTLLPGTPPTTRWESVGSKSCIDSEGRGATWTEYKRADGTVCAQLEAGSGSAPSTILASAAWMKFANSAATANQEKIATEEKKQLEGF